MYRTCVLVRYWIRFDFQSESSFNPLRCNIGDQDRTSLSICIWEFVSLQFMQGLFIKLFFSPITVLSHWDFFHGKFELLYRGKTSCDRLALPNLYCMRVGCFSVSIIYRTPTWTTGSLPYGQMSMHAIAQREYRHFNRVCTESCFWEKNPLPERFSLVLLKHKVVVFHEQQMRISFLS